MSKRQPLEEILTLEFFEEMYKKEITNQHEMATEVRKRNGGTCSQSTINRYMKKLGLAPDRPTGRLQQGIDIKRVQKIYRLLEPYKINPVTIYKYHGDQLAEDMVLIISDLQIGAMETDDGFDPVPEDIIRDYMDVMKANLAEELQNQNVLVSNFHLFLLGDIVDGELVYPAQQSIDMSEQMRIAVTIMLELIEFLKQHCDDVHVYSVAGNHGNISFRNHKRSNWDNVIFATLDAVYTKDSLVTIHLENHDPVKIDRIGKWKFLYTHGHIIRGMFTREKLKSQTQDWFFSIGEFDASLFGHWHTATYFQINGKPVIINGCAYKSEFIRKQIGGLETLGMVMFEVGHDTPVKWFKIVKVE